MSPPSSQLKIKPSKKPDYCLLHSGSFLGLFFSPEGGGDMFPWNVCWLSVGLNGIISQKIELVSSVWVPANDWTATVKITYMLCASKLLPQVLCCFNSATVLDLYDKQSFTQLYTLIHNGTCVLYIYRWVFMYNAYLKMGCIRKVRWRFWHKFQFHGEKLFILL
jgi:hypothetical protein